MAKQKLHQGPAERPLSALVQAHPCGGYSISCRGDFDSPRAQAAFSTLDEVLTWLRANMAQPVFEGKTP